MNNDNGININNKENITQERLIGFASSQGDELLKALKDRFDLCANRSDLAFIRAHYNKCSKEISADELLYLDSLLRARKCSPQGYAISKLDMADKGIAETYEDMITKLAMVCGHRTVPPTLNEFSSLATTHLAASGRISSFRGARVYRGECARGDLLVKNSVGEVIAYLPSSSADEAKNTFWEIGTCFALLCPRDDSIDYDKAVEKFLDDEDAKTELGKHFRADSFGLLYSIAKDSRGIFADPSRIPLVEKPVTLSGIDKKLTGLFVVTLKKESLEKITAIAEKYGVNAVYFAKTTNTEKLVLDKQNNPFCEFELSFLRALAGAPQDGHAVIEHEDPQSACLHSTIDFSLADSDDYFYKCGALAEHNGVLVAAAHCDENKGAYSIALNTSIDAAIALASKGVAPATASVTFRYRFPVGDASPAAIGQNLAAIIGTYRFQEELFIPEYGSRIIYEGEKRSFSAILSAPLPASVPSDKFKEVGSNVYFLTFNRKEDHSPDMESIRRMWEYMAYLSSKGVVLSAAPVTGSMALAIKKLEVGSLYKLSLDAELENCYAQGIILECRDELSVKKLGITINKAQ